MGTRGVEPSPFGAARASKDLTFVLTTEGRRAPQVSQQLESSPFRHPREWRSPGTLAAATPANKAQPRHFPSTSMMRPVVHAWRAFLSGA
jgi:hypothetical protein